MLEDVPSSDDQQARIRVQFWRYFRGVWVKEPSEDVILLGRNLANSQPNSIYK